MLCFIILFQLISPYDAMTHEVRATFTGNARRVLSVIASTIYHQIIIAQLKRMEWGGEVKYGLEGDQRG